MVPSTDYSPGEIGAIESLSDMIRLDKESECASYLDRDHMTTLTHIFPPVFLAKHLCQEKGATMIEDNTGHNEPMDDDALTEEDEALALNELESEDHTEDEQTLTHHVILEQGTKHPPRELQGYLLLLSSSSKANVTWRDISGGTQNVAAASTQVQVDTSLAQVQVSDTTHLALQRRKEDKK